MSQTPSLLINVLSGPSRSLSPLARSLSPMSRGRSLSPACLSPQARTVRPLRSLAAAAAAAGRSSRRDGATPGRTPDMLAGATAAPSTPNISAYKFSTITVGTPHPGLTGRITAPRLYVPKEVAAGGAAAAATSVGGSQQFSAVAAAADVADDLDCQGASYTEMDETEIMKLTFYSKFSPTPVSLGHFLNHGSKGSIEDSFLFLRREIPVRLAQIMMELQLLPHDLLQQATCQEIQNQYAESFKDVLRFENLPNAPHTYAKFNDSLSMFRQRHIDTIAHMAEAVLAWKKENGREVDVKDGANRSIQYFLDRLYMSRISINMLISHHKLLFCPEESGSAPIGMIGTIDPNCNVEKVAAAAYENASFLCDQMYLDAPKLKLMVKDVSKKGMNFVYVPSHLYHMMFELFKNSMRATMEFHEDSSEIPPIDVLIVKSTQDITIRVSDQGGGISRNEVDKAFLYLYTTGDRVQLSSGDMGGTASTTTPMHGLGYGLPLSKLYARYFGGDIKLASCDGYGTDAYIYLKALSADAHEMLPIFNKNSYNKMKNTATQVHDWTASTTD